MVLQSIHTADLKMVHANSLLRMFHLEKVKHGSKHIVQPIVLLQQNLS